ncbi:hypothetical protein PPYR_06297 [Photinus pyralis]|uniref:RAP domain-containing protein n=1 Tax=Photinus pyralis TaxID=7054 RepID=A0A1Y1NDN7_PHOPY|nr:uncharacterized protein LOC116166650 [Photinus pyralis]XP_031337543.1 uncharacterized protein LOC116166650 [Photinus pyralis]KAB0800557.1 hypothetical protein PPYR_06297 [Photinus pyralis]
MKAFDLIAQLTRLRRIHTDCRLYSKINKEFSKAPVTVASSAPDYLIQNLRNARSSQNVLEIVKDHYNIMNSKQVMQALRSIYLLQKQGSQDLSTQQIMKNPSFERLCHKLKSQAGLIELNETIEALKVVSYVGVSSTSTIVQVLLQLLRHNINDLSLHHIIFLDFLLRQFKSSPLVEALLIALPIVFDVNLPVKIETRNVTYLVEYLQYVSKKRVSEKCISLIVNNLKTHCQDGSVLEPKLAKSIIWSICDMEDNEFFEPLLKDALNAMLFNIDAFDWRDLETTLSKLATKYSPQYPFYYDEVFYDTCASYVIDKDLGFQEALYTLRKMLKPNHSNEKLLSYLSQKCHEDPHLLLKAPPMTIFTVAISISLTEFRPIHWETMKNALAETTCFQDYKKPDILWMKLAAALCSLDVYKFDVLDKCFSDSYLESMIKQRNIFDFGNFILVCQAINAFQPNYAHLLPSTNIINNIFAQINHNENYPLEVPLIKGLGGEVYVKTGVTSKLAHHIDHVVVLRKGGYPISLPQDAKHLEDITVAPDSQIVLILVLGPSHYTINNKKLKASTALMIKTLEAKNYTVIPFSLEVWEGLADFEKVPYLMQEIKSSIENEQNMSEIR